MRSLLSSLKDEFNQTAFGSQNLRNYFLYKGYENSYDEPNVIARAHAIKSLFLEHEKHIYLNDLVGGSIKGLMGRDFSEEALSYGDKVAGSYGFSSFQTNFDHYAPDYEGLLKDGIEGKLEKIKISKARHRGDKKKEDFLSATKISLKAFSKMIEGYGQAAKEKAAKAQNELQRENLLRIYKSCQRVKLKAPQSFHEALQLVWLSHISFVYEGRYAMALGRMDQYLYPYYKKDREKGELSNDFALSLLESTLYKIKEHTHLGNDDVVNIAIGGLTREGLDATNPLSYLILEAVKNCKIPGPNLSARIHKDTEDKFLDEALKVIGTGLGYPALMNDEVNIKGLLRYGYSLEDARDYSMVGCIENFITGKQAPWSDGRFNVPKYIELALNDGRCMLKNIHIGPRTGDVKSFKTMEDFKKALIRQIEFGASEYMMLFRNENDRYNRANYSQPHLAYFTVDSIERGLDINDGGTIYPSVHGACCMGIGTFADSLAAIEDLVFEKSLISLSQLRDALVADFKGYNDIKALAEGAPKYGNNDDRADKYAVWYLEILDQVFKNYRTPDGGGVYIGVASNVNNIPAGKEIAASPDGRHARMPLSDAASPSPGMDRRGPTALINSVSKPDYSLAACGTVLNQKYSSEMFINDTKRKKLLSLIRTYFNKGGQEVQINAVSKDILKDAMENPKNYEDLVVRVSGFSALFINLDREVQIDILNRTEHA